MLKKVKDKSLSADKTKAKSKKKASDPPDRVCVLLHTPRDALAHALDPPDRVCVQQHTPGVYATTHTG